MLISVCWMQEQTWRLNMTDFWKSGRFLWTISTNEKHPKSINKKGAFKMQKTFWIWGLESQGEHLASEKNMFRNTGRMCPKKDFPSIKDRQNPRFWGILGIFFGEKKKSIAPVVVQVRLRGWWFQIFRKMGKRFGIGKANLPRPWTKRFFIRVVSWNFPCFRFWLCIFLKIGGGLQGN